MQGSIKTKHSIESGALKFQNIDKMAYAIYNIRTDVRKKSAKTKEGEI